MPRIITTSAPTLPTSHLGRLRPYQPNPPESDQNIALETDAFSRAIRMPVWQGRTSLVRPVPPLPEFVESQPLKGTKVVVVVAHDFIADEMRAYADRFAQYGAEVVFAARLWNQPSATFASTTNCGTMPVEWMKVTKDVDNLKAFKDEGVSIVIASASNAMMRAAYALNIEAPEDNPVTDFFAKAVESRDVVVGANCHGLLALLAQPDAIKGRHVTCNGDVAGSVRNAGAVLEKPEADKASVTDDRLVTSDDGRNTNLFIDDVVRTYVRLHPEAARAASADEVR